MSNTKHTPGPWTILDDNEESCSPGIEAPGVEFSVIVIGYPQHDADDDAGVHGRTPEEKRANARLIATSPDLLEVAKEWLSMFDNFSIIEIRKRWDEKTVQRMLRTRAVIAKTKG